MKFCKHVFNLQRWKVNHFPCRSCLGEIEIKTISMNFIPIFWKGEKKIRQL
jgi:hypothetical protein